MLSNKQLLKLNKESVIKGLFPSTIAFTAEEAERFLTVIVDQSFLKNNARVVMMAKEKKNIRYIGLGTNKVFWPAATLDQTKYVKELAHEKIELSVSKARGCVQIPDDDLEDNIEGEDFARKLMDEMVAPAGANELEEAFLVGSAVSPPTTLTEQWDGWYTLALASAAAGAGDVMAACGIVDASATTTPYIAEIDADSPYGWKFKFQAMINALPTKYRKYKDKLRFYVSPGVRQDYRMAIAARGTSVGDAALLQGGDMSYDGIKIVEVALLPETQGTGSDETFVMLTWAENLIVGLHRSLKIETERSAPDEATRFWLSLRADVKIENNEAVVICKKMKVRGS